MNAGSGIKQNLMPFKERCKDQTVFVIWLLDNLFPECMLLDTQQIQSEKCSWPLITGSAINIETDDQNEWHSMKVFTKSLLSYFSFIYILLVTLNRFLKKDS